MLGTAAANTVTVTVATGGPYVVGEPVTIAGFTSASYNGAYFITSVGSGYITYTDATSGLAAATVVGTVGGFGGTVITDRDTNLTIASPASSTGITTSSLQVFGKGTTILSGNNFGLTGSYVTADEGVLDAVGTSSTNPLGSGNTQTITAASSSSTTKPSPRPARTGSARPWRSPACIRPDTRAVHRHRR